MINQGLLKPGSFFKILIYVFFVEFSVFIISLESKKEKMGVFQEGEYH
jgi:hypothetical protein